MNGTWTFGQKLGLGFGLVVAVTVGIAGAAIYANRTVSESKDRVIESAVQDLAGAMGLQASSSRREAVVRGYLLSADPGRLAEERVMRDEAVLGIAALREQARPDGQRLLDAISAALRDHAAATDEVTALKRSGDADVAAIERRWTEQMVPRAATLRQAIDAFVAHRRGQVDEERLAASEAASRTQALLLAAALLAVLLAVVTAVVLGRALDRQVGAAIQHIQSSSSELHAAASQQASATREQGAAMTEIGTTIRELLATSRQIAEGAQRVARIADDTASAARSGDAVVAKAQEAITDTKRQMELVVEKMLDLGRRSQQIGGVLELVGELLEQTNILAINATIEASGAGEAGRRFAAVADEIRKLSDRVGGSAREIRALVDEVRASVHGTIMATEGGSKSVEAGTRRFGEVATTFQRIVEQVSTTTEAAREIELSTKQQSTAVEQVNTAIANVTQTSRETEASAAQTVQTASELTTLSRELSRLVRTDA